MSLSNTQKRLQIYIADADRHTKKVLDMVTTSQQAFLFVLTRPRHRRVLQEFTCVKIGPGISLSLGINPRLEGASWPESQEIPCLPPPEHGNYHTRENRGGGIETNPWDKRIGS